MTIGKVDRHRRHDAGRRVWRDGGHYGGRHRNGDMLSAIGADVAWCEADLAQVKRAKAQTEGRALIALRDATDLRRLPRAVPSRVQRVRPETGGGRAVARGPQGGAEARTTSTGTTDEAARAASGEGGTSGSEAEAGEDPGET